MPSTPKPMMIVRGVVIAAPTGKLEASVRIQLLALAALPGGGPVTAQPSRLVSNDVLPSPVDTTTSSTKTPRPWLAQSLAYAMETSTC